MMDGFTIHNGEELYIPFETETGQGWEVIPLIAIAVRMEMLGEDDPGVALEIIRAEHEVPAPYESLNLQEPDLEPMRMATRMAIPMAIKADSQPDHTVKEHLRVDLADKLSELRAEAHKVLFPHPTPEES